MQKKRLNSLLLWMSLCSFPLHAQIAGFPTAQGEKTDADAAMKRALHTSSLTFEGRPFHAVMDIGSQGDEYSGRVEVWWISDSKYKVVLKSPKFSQEKVVNGDAVYEKSDGDYYPRWLENFVLAILDPVPMAKNFHIAGPQVSENCLKHEDKPDGITNELTFVVICTTSSQGGLDFVLTFNDYMHFKDIKDFGPKEIAGSYETRVKNFQMITGRLTVLEELQTVDDAMFTLQQVTPREELIATAFVSTSEEESLIESAPDIQWPVVREGKTEGYMIVYARTDRTGQVRETAKHNSDNSGLEDFGMEQALKFKFKPLVVAGVTEQMEMPLVLHFKTSIIDPIPELDDATTRKQISGCVVPHEISDPASTSKQIVITFQVQEDGRLMTLGSSDRKIPVMSLYQQFRGCHFALLKQNGKPTAYHANLTVTAR